jgi:hypothetical protein
MTECRGAFSPDMNQLGLHDNFFWLPSSIILQERNNPFSESMSDDELFDVTTCSARTIGKTGQSNDSVSRRQGRMTKQVSAGENRPLLFGRLVSFFRLIPSPDPHKKTSFRRQT